MKRFISDSLRVLSSALRMVLHCFCKLKKAIYGLKQAGRNWYLTIASFFKSQGLVASQNDPCLFVRLESDSSLYVALWVDDLIYFSTDPQFLQQFEDDIEKIFTISEKSALHWFLGMRVDFGDDGEISLSQQQYICDLLKTIWDGRM